ncbi:MAG TPA: DUF3995 domain-containing protein [Micromonosporaceae bacterium]|nr:DUF3995 domain-containing protein [Micromonosporaceae bacterium]
MTESRRRRLGLVLLWLAAAAGAVHTAFSVYWAFGGMWLLETVGQGAVDQQRDNRPLAASVLLLAAAVKGAGAVVPVWVEYRGGPRIRRRLRAVSWVGGAVLVCYGSVIAAVSAAVLAGAVSPGGEIDRVGLIGHALLWNPLFACWGVLLLAGLWWTRREPEAQRDRYPAGR